MAAVMSIEAVWAALPDGPLNEKEFDDALRRIFKIPGWDGAKLDGYRTTAFHNRLVLQNVDGLIVKATELPRWPTEDERLEAQRVRERKEMFAATAEGAGWVGTPRDGTNTTVWTADSVTNPVRVQTVTLINEVVAERFIALEERVSDLQEQLAALTPLEIVA